MPKHEQKVKPELTHIRFYTLQNPNLPKKTKSFIFTYKQKGEKPNIPGAGQHIETCKPTISTFSPRKGIQSNTSLLKRDIMNLEKRHRLVV